MVSQEDIFIKDSDKKSITINLNKKLVENFKAECLKANITMTTIVEVFMRDFGDGKLIMDMEKNETTNKLEFVIKERQIERG